ncbi:hypothetical protein NDU88_003606, partial [Pleurodeles waltl]
GQFAQSEVCPQIGSDRKGRMGSPAGAKRCLRCTLQRSSFNTHTIHVTGSTGVRRCLGVENIAVGKAQPS